MPIPDQKKAFNVVKRYFHNPQVSNADARMLLDEFCRIYPGSPLLRKLRLKHLFHRILGGHKYHDVGQFALNTDMIAQRIASSKPADPRDVLLVSHEMSLTGAPRALLTLAVTLKRLGYRPVILTCRKGDLIAEADAEGITVVGDLTAVLTHMLHPSDTESQLSRFIQSFPTVLYNTIDTMISFSLIPTRSGTRKLGWIHEAEGAYSHFDGDIKGFNDFIRSFDDIFIVGDFARSHAVKHSELANRFKNLFYGVTPIDKSLFIPTQTASDGYLHMLIAGSICRRKGHHILQQALRMLDRSTLSAIRIHVVGAPMDTGIAKKLSKEDNATVICHGEMAHDELMQLFPRMDLLLCPSLDDPMPIVCTEAFQLGIPVLVSDHTGTASFIRDGENGFIVNAGDASSLADGLRRVVAKRADLKAIGAAAFEIYNNNFSFESFSKRLSQIFPPLPSQ